MIHPVPVGRTIALLMTRIEMVNGAHLFNGIALPIANLIVQNLAQKMPCLSQRFPYFGFTFENAEFALVTNDSI